MGYKSGQNIGIRLMLLRDYFNTHGGKTTAVKRKELEKYLSDSGFPIERKTLYTDLELLETYFHMEIRYDPSKKGYIYENPPFEPYEIRLLVDSVYASKFITRQKAREIAGKVKQFADPLTRKTLDRQTYVSDRVRSMNESVVRDSERIHEAIAADKQISFQYFHYSPDKSKPKTYSKNGQPYIVSPFALLWNNGNYYLYAYVSEKQEFRVFRIDRMERISVPLAAEREGKEAYNIKNLTTQKAKVFEMYHGAEYLVEMRFANCFANAVIDQFGKDLIMIPSGGEHFIFRAAVEVSPPFYAWIATFGRAAQILSPAPVVEEMKQFLSEALEMYKE